MKVLLKLKTLGELVNEEKGDMSVRENNYKIGDAVSK